MIMKKIFGALTLLSHLAVAAQDTGVHFTHERSWSNALATARRENKPIFVDCFTTWCGPCKAMDKIIYTNPGVGAYMDTAFIAVRLQLDTTSHDNDLVRSWYSDAHAFLARYNITAFPTFLFFSPEGNLVDWAVGARNVKDFTALLEEATDPARQYVTLVNKYREGKLDYPAMADLRERAKRNGDKELADSIAQNFLHHYLYRLRDDELYTKDHLQFMASAVQNSREKGFDVFYRHPARVDQVMARKGYARQMADGILWREVVKPIFLEAKNQNRDPNWSLIRTRIGERTTQEDADRVVFINQLNWYSDRYTDKKPKPLGWAEGVLKVINFNAFDKYGIDTSGFGWLPAGNCIEYYILGHSTDTLLLQKALGWIGMVMQVFPGEGFSYVYGGLLYRLGYPKQGMAWQQMTLRLFEDNLLKEHKTTEDDKLYQAQNDILTAMKKGVDIRPMLPKLYNLN